MDYSLSELSSEVMKHATMRELEKIQEQLEQDDLEYYESGVWREKYYAGPMRSRTIVMNEGVIRFTRRYYRYKKQPGGVFYIDEKYQIQKGKRIADDIRNKMVDLYNQYVSVYAIAELYQVTRQTVYNILREKGLKDIVYEVEPNLEVETVYIQADEDHVRKQHNKYKNKNEQVRIICVHEGVEEECKGRNRLKNRFFKLSTMLEDPDEYWEQVAEYIAIKYPKAKNIYLGGDAGPWIKRGLQSLPRFTTYVYDWFHLKNHIERIFGKGHLSKQAMACIKENDALALELMYQEQLKKHPEKKAKYWQNISPIWNNWEAARKNFIDPNYHGTSAEGQVSHYCSRYFSSRPKAFNADHLRKYVRLREYSLNNYTANTLMRLPARIGAECFRAVQKIANGIRTVFRNSRMNLRSVI